MTRYRLAAATLTAALLLAPPGAAIAKTQHASVKVTGVVKALNPATDAISLSVRTRAAHRHRGHARTLTFNISNADISGHGGAVAVGERVTVTYSSSSPQDATGIRILGAPNGGSAGHGAAFTGEISAVNASSDTFTLTQGQDASSANSFIVQVTGTTIFSVPGAADGGASGLSDLSVGDRAVVFTDDVTAVPVVAIAVLDIGHGQHGPPPPPPPPPPTSEPVNGMVTAVDTSAQTLTMLAPAQGGGTEARLDGSPTGETTGNGGTQSVTVQVTSSTRFGGQNASRTVQGLGDIAVGDLITVQASGDISSGTLTALGVYDHGQPPQVGPMNHVIGSVTAVSTVSATVTLTVSEGPNSGQSVTAQLSSATKLFVGDPSGTPKLADIRVGDRVGIGFLGTFASQVDAVILYDMSNPPSSSH